MKVVLMAAGKGIRILPLTNSIPKVLIEINGKPFLHYVIKNLKKAGLTDLGIIVGYKKEKIKDFLKKDNLDAAIIEQQEQKGTAHAILQAEEFCNNENFIVSGADNLCSPEDFKAISKDDNLNYIASIETKNPEKYGVLITKGDKLLKIVEKPKQSTGNLINTGLYKFTPEIFKAIKQIKKSERGEYELTDAVSILAKQRKVKVIKIRDYWLDLGCKDDIPKIGDFLRNIQE